jgi:hypothetical protein
MDEKSLFTTFWTNESATTRNVLARIPEGSDYRPDPKSRTAREIAWQIVCEEQMIIEALKSGKAEWAPPPTPAHLSSLAVLPRLSSRAQRGICSNVLVAGYQCRTPDPSSLPLLGMTGGQIIDSDPLIRTR